MANGLYTALARNLGRIPLDDGCIFPMYAAAFVSSKDRYLAGYIRQVFYFRLKLGACAGNGNIFLLVEEAVAGSAIADPFPQQFCFPWDSLGRFHACGQEDCPGLMDLLPQADSIIIPHRVNGSDLPRHQGKPYPFNLAQEGLLHLLPCHIRQAWVIADAFCLFNFGA